MKVLYFDLERGHQTLGSKKDIQSMFGYPVLSPYTWDEFQQIIGQVYTTTKVERTNKIGKIEVKEHETVVVPRDNTPVDALILDTFSELSKKFQRSLTDKTGKMKLQEWGKLKNKLDTCLEFISRIPGVIILTCHAKTQTMDDGVNKIIPYIDGSTKEDISKWFDFVFYTTTIKDGKDRKYMWITKRSEKYDHAKDRTNLLPEMIDQDYGYVINAVKEKGFENCRILVIGSPGSGKTYSLASLTQPKPDDKPNVATQEYQNEGETNG